MCRVQRWLLLWKQLARCDLKAYSLGSFMFYRADSSRGDGMVIQKPPPYMRCFRCWQLNTAFKPLQQSLIIFQLKDLTMLYFHKSSRWAQKFLFSFFSFLRLLFPFEQRCGLTNKRFGGFVFGNKDGTLVVLQNFGRFHPFLNSSRPVMFFFPSPRPHILFGVQYAKRIGYAT